MDGQIRADSLNMVGFLPLAELIRRDEFSNLGYKIARISAQLQVVFAQ